MNDESEQIHGEKVYETLPTKWEGAPEFKWRKCATPEERGLLLIENVTRADLYNPWLYPVVLRADRVITEFSRPNSEQSHEIPNFGEIELHYENEGPIFFAVATHLIHLRVLRGDRTIKIHLPETEWLTTRCQEMESRFGRIREPIESMKYLVIKGIPENTTENQVREIAFPSHDIDEVIFACDNLGKHCAVIKFPCAEGAVAAHATHSFVAFENDVQGCRRYRVLYAYNAITNWGIGLTKRPITRSSLEMRVIAKEREIDGNSADKMITATPNDSYGNRKAILPPAITEQPLNLLAVKPWPDERPRAPPVLPAMPYWERRPFPAPWDTRLSDPYYNVPNIRPLGGYDYDPYCDYGMIDPRVRYGIPSKRRR